jgi:hypothetical protein
VKVASAFIAARQRNSTPKVGSEPPARGAERDDVGGTPRLCVDRRSAFTSPFVAVFVDASVDVSVGVSVFIDVSVD